MITAIIQARMSSTRLPGKALVDICGKSMLLRVIERVRASRTIEQVVVATTESESDDDIVRKCHECRVNIFRGSEQDVLNRYFKAAQKFNATVIVRITSDCPLIDPDEIDKVVDFYLNNRSIFNLVSNAIEPSFPDGLDVSTFSFEALQQAEILARLPSEREHVTPWIIKHMRAKNILCEQDLSTHRWTVDQSEDLEFVRYVYQIAINEGMYLPKLKDVLDIIKSRPEMKSINSSITRDEGYKNSLEKDKIFLSAIDNGAKR